MPNHHAGLRLEVHAMESGKWWSCLMDAEESAHTYWESREYETMEDAYDAAKYEWDARAEAARDAYIARRQ